MADIVLVEDEDILRRSLTTALEQWGHAARSFGSAEDALEAIAQGEPDVLLTDHRLPGMTGLDLLREVRAAHPQVAIVVITAHATVNDAVQAMKAGAADYLTKPVDIHELGMVLDRCMAGVGLKHELDYYRRRDLSDAAIDAIVGESSAVDELRAMTRRVATLQKKGGECPTVLLIGETGTGKGLIARALHQCSPHSRAPFVEVNCAALPDDLLEGELMGYERGAFTGATVAKAGLFEAAESGTMFLDEIGRMSMALQAKLLKVIEERSVRRLGSTRSRELGCSVVVASHMDLQAAVERGDFLEDLFHRINVFVVRSPPLRDRGSDVLLLAEHYMRQHATEYDLPVPTLSETAKRALERYRWPGNIRELSHTLERAVVLCRQGVVEPDDLSFFTERALRPAVTVSSSAPVTVDFDDGAIALDEVEARLIRAALEHTGGNQLQAAKLLGISRDTLRYRIKHLPD